MFLYWPLHFINNHLGKGGAVAEVGGEGAGLSGTGTMWPDKKDFTFMKTFMEVLEVKLKPSWPGCLMQ